MNRLPLEKRIHIVNLLVEGMSLRAAARISGCSLTTVIKLLEDVGKACIDFHNEQIVNIKSRNVQVDEIWSYVHTKQKNIPEEGKPGCGDAWTWVAIDGNTKLVISWFVGDRTERSAQEFMKDLSGRVSGRIQLTSDGYKAYEDAVVDNFIGIDYGQLVKIYENVRKDKTKKPLEKYKGTKRVPIIGSPDISKIHTSHIERQNLTMRMSIRRFTRETNGFSKKLVNHCYAIALNFVYYNFCRIHSTIRVTPAMEAGIMKEPMEIEDIIYLIN